MITFITSNKQKFIVCDDKASRMKKILVADGLEIVKEYPTTRKEIEEMNKGFEKPMKKFIA